jgi:hypothetical protein
VVFVFISRFIKYKKMGKINKGRWSLEDVILSNCIKLEIGI